MPAAASACPILHFTEPTISGAPGARPSPKHAAEGVHFYGIAERRTSAVGFDVANGRRFQSRLLQRGPHHGCLRRPIRHRETAARTVLVDGRAADHRNDRVLCRHRVGKTLERDHPTAFTTHKAVRRRVEHLAAPIGSERVRARQVHGYERRQHHVDAAGERKVALALAKTLAGEVQCHERRRACRVHRQARPAKPEHVRQPS